MKKLLFTLCLVSAHSIATVIPEEPHIYVEGYAEKAVLPDQVELTIIIEHTHLKSATAKENVDNKSLLLFNIANKMGLNKKDITSMPLQISAAYEYNSGKRSFIGNKVTRNITVTLKDISHYSHFTQEIIDSDISTKISSKIKLTSKRAHTKKLQQLALADAKQNATDLAQLQGVKIDDVHSISQFNMRKEDALSLLPNNQAYEKSLNKMQSVSFNSAAGNSIFEIDKVMLSAKIYVVYTIKD